jgi:hypothetical protein
MKTETEIDMLVGILEQMRRGDWIVNSKFYVHVVTYSWYNLVFSGDKGTIIVAENIVSKIKSINLHFENRTAFITWL